VGKVLIVIKCALCDKEFKKIVGLGIHVRAMHKEIPIEEYYLKYINPNSNICKSCGKNTKFANISRGFYDYCSPGCVLKNKNIQEKIKETNLERYGSEYQIETKKTRDKIKKTNLEKYGVEYSFQSESVKEKIKEVNLEKYGVENYSQTKEGRERISKRVKEEWKNPEIQENRKKGYLKSLGVDHPLKSKEIIEKRKKTCLKKYGGIAPICDENIKNKMFETNIKKYGSKIVLSNSNIQEKIKKTNLERYGSEYIMKLDEFKEKSKQTCLDRYGVNNISKLDEIKEKLKDKNLKNMYVKLLNSDRLKEKVKPNFKLDKYKGCDHNNKYSWICCKCNNEFKDHIDDGHIPKCPFCYPLLVGTSKGEKEVSDFCKQYYPNLIENSRSIIPPLELDIYIPEKKLAIEFDGLYWHSEINGNKDPNYHLNKTLQCEEKGIQLLHIFEDEWLNKQDIVKSIIKSKLGIYDQKIYARKPEFKFVSHEKANQFLFDNHLQGTIKSKHYGLYHNNELVSLISISKPRFNKNYEWELLRFCNKKNTQVTGSLSKLIKNFRKTNHGSIISYCDKRYSYGSGYINSGFEQISITKPSYYYIKYFDRYNRMKFQKHKLEEQLEIYDSNLTEWQNMQLNEYDRIFDCGNLVLTI
jgi:hypothetical protein